MIYRLWRRFLAFYHLSDSAVCEMSAGRGEYDGYHDYDDSSEGVPMHWYLYYCKRCGKGFYI